MRGLLFDNALKGGVCLQEGMYFIQRCLSRNHGNHDFASGFRVEFNCQTFMTKCLALQSGWYGFWAYGNSTVEFTDCSAKQNNLGGISCGTLSAGNFYGTGDYSDNMLTGIRAIHNSRLWFANTYSGKIYNNKSCGMELNWDSYSENHARNPSAAIWVEASALIIIAIPINSRIGIAGNRNSSPNSPVKRIG